MLKLKSFKKIAEGPFIIPILCLLSLLCMCLVTLITSFAVMSLDDPGSGVELSALVTLIASAIISGFFSERLSGAIRDCFIALLAVGIILTVLGLIFGNLPSGIMNAVCFAGVGALSSLLSKALRSKRKRRR